MKREDEIWLEPEEAETTYEEMEELVEEEPETAEEETTAPEEELEEILKEKRPKVTAPLVRVWPAQSVEIKGGPPVAIKAGSEDIIATDVDIIHHRPNRVWFNPLAESALVEGERYVVCSWGISKGKVIVRCGTTSEAVIPW